MGFGMLVARREIDPGGAASSSFALDCLHEPRAYAAPAVVCGDHDVDHPAREALAIKARDEMRGDQPNDSAA